MRKEIYKHLIAIYEALLFLSNCEYLDTDELAEKKSKLLGEIMKYFREQIDN